MFLFKFMEISELGFCAWITILRIRIPELMTLILHSRKNWVANMAVTEAFLSVNPSPRLGVLMSGQVVGKLSMTSKKASLASIFRFTV